MEREKKNSFPSPVAWVACSWASDDLATRLQSSVVRFIPPTPASCSFRGPRALFPSPSLSFYPLLPLLLPLLIILLPSHIAFCVKEDRRSCRCCAVVARKQKKKKKKKTEGGKLSEEQTVSPAFALFFLLKGEHFFFFSNQSFFTLSPCPHAPSFARSTPASKLDTSPAYHGSEYICLSVCCHRWFATTENDGQFCAGRSRVVDGSTIGCCPSMAQRGGRERRPGASWPWPSHGRPRACAAEARRHRPNEPVGEHCLSESRSSWAQ